MRSHYISRQTLFYDHWIKGANINKFFASSAVSRRRFGWCFWMEQLNQVFVNNAMYSDFYAKYWQIEPETQIQESQLGLALMYQSTRSFSIPPPPPNPPGIWLFSKLLFKFPPTWAKMPFKCPTLGSIQVIKRPHPGNKTLVHSGGNRCYKLTECSAFLCVSCNIQSVL